MNAIGLLEEKVDALLKRHLALAAELKKTKRHLAKKETELQQLAQIVAEAESRLTGSSIAKSLPEKKERNAARKKIDAVIAEIDKILMNLND